MAKERLAAYAYNPTKYPPVWEIRLGNVDITDDVNDIEGLRTSLDVMKPTEFQTQAVRVILSNASNKWTLLSDSNGFTEAGYNSRGFRAPIEIRSGYLVDGTPQTEVLFKGLITNAEHLAKPSRVQLTVSDDSQLLTRNTISDFGIQRFLQLEKDRATEHGRYAIPGALLEVSEGSLSGTSGASPLVVRDALETEGSLNPLNVTVDGDYLESEGDFLPADPQVEFRSPFRWKEMQTLVEALLTAHDVTEYFVEVPKIAIAEAFFETRGRVGYDVINTRLAEQNKVWSWGGHVTDVKYHSSTGDYFFLYSHRRNDTPPKLIHYQKSTETERVILEGDADMEWWKLHIKSDSPLTFEILGTDVPSDPLTPTLGAYNSLETGSGVKIWRGSVVESSGRYVVRSALAAVNTGFNPQLAQSYWFGYTPDGANNNERQSFRPDTRKNFLGTDYHTYVGNQRVGVTHAGSGLVEFFLDGNFNETCFDFWVSGQTLFAGCTWIIGESSTLKVVSKRVT